MSDALPALLARWREDPAGTYRSWFLWEERLKNLRSDLDAKQYRELVFRAPRDEEAKPGGAARAAKQTRTLTCT